MSFGDFIGKLKPGSSTAKPSGLPDGMVPAEKLAAQARRDATSTPTGAPAGDPELLAKRDRLTEQFTILQAELGGAFYEMAIRDHIRLDVLTQKAAVLQRLDWELAELDRSLSGDPSPATANCPACGTPHGAQSRFCSSCGYVLQPGGGAGSAAATAVLPAPGAPGGAPAATDQPARGSTSSAARGATITNGSAATTHAVPQTGPAAANGRTIT